MIDSVSVGLKRDLEVPARHIEQAQDLPVQEIQTTSLSAFRSAVEGYTALVLDSDWQNAARHFENAVADDPTYASAQHTLFQVYLYLNRAQDGIAPIQAAMEHIYRLPEREQFEVKSDYYFTRQDDIEGRAALAQLLIYQDKRDEAIAQYMKILEIDPEQYDYLREIGAVYESRGEFEEALEYYTAYAEQFPDDRASFTTIGDLHRNIGNHEQAREYYEKALLLDPDDVGVMVQLAAIENDLGAYDRALEQCEEALAVAKTPQGRMAVYEGLRTYYESRGQLERAIEYIHLAQIEREAFAPPLLVLMTRFRTLGTYVEAGHENRAYETLETVRSELAPPWDAFFPMGELRIYLALEEPDSAERALEDVVSMVQTFSYNFLQPTVLRARGRIHEMRGEYEEAILAYEEELELQPTDEAIHELLGRCYRELGDLDEAQAQLSQTLSIRPYDATAHYELALVYSAMGDTDKALEHLRTALDVWSEADPAFTPAQRARAKLEELMSAR
ncbi:MAG: hypothetical protein AMS25_12775 [Gemmatimonas sp. SM23_52]|nr:MAG: hypothetical protein AMS25_12775 [Gemmatimonas sp. SM23_52]